MLRFRILIIKKVTSGSPSVVVLDWAGEYGDLLPEATVIRQLNPFALPSDAEVKEHAATITMMFHDILRLTEPQAHMLYNVLLEEYEESRSSTNSPNVSSVLIRNNETRRSISEANMKYPKTDFSGNPAELASLCGFINDCGVARNGKQILVSTATTHPAQIKEFSNDYGGYGHIGRTPCYSKQFSLYYWHVYVYLKRPSFDFLVEYKSNPLKFLSLIGAKEFVHTYIASLIDAEGTVGVYLNHGHPRPVLIIANKNRLILEWAQRILGGVIFPTNTVYELQLVGEKAVEALQILPIIHEEKAAAREIILHYYNNGGIGLKTVSAYRELRRRIDEEVRLCTLQARLEWIQRHGKPHKNDPDQTIMPN